MSEFYFGSDKVKGLEGMLDEKVDIGKACSIQLDYDGEPIEIRVGQYGPFVYSKEKLENLYQVMFFWEISMLTKL